jgi:hypothetical protein
MGFFACISRRPKADLEPLRKRDSAADLLPVKVRILIPRSPGEAAGSGRKWQCAEELLEKSWHILARAREIKPDIVARIRLSGAAGDLAGIDVENLACCVDVGEGQGVGAGHPDLRAELCQFIEQRRAPGRIEMGHHFVEQQ